MHEKALATDWLAWCVQRYVLVVSLDHGNEWMSCTGVMVLIN